MSGLINNGLPQQSVFTGSEQLNLDTQLSAGQAPQSAMSTLIQLASALKYLGNALDKTMVAGTRYYVNYSLGTAALLTGIQVLVGSTGGTDLWTFELHDSTGALVATSLATGTTAGTANTFQRLAFTATYQAAAGTYFLVAQSNGTTAKLGTYASPGLPLLTGSATGTLGTGAAITPPTTYTANLGPIASVY
ncbi:MAG: hypothetical protein JWR51_4631 [Devosia sp.]|uniref:hypothetical protein n=1 Tax=Devosia sp. TaxID=1871048 RepID=UPI002605A6A7|nr:hypothetical protein [Devosia sp.]MDB5531528.1 hypothetical protein [Devosia sp.]